MCALLRSACLPACLCELINICQLQNSNSRFRIPHTSAQSRCVLCRNRRKPRTPTTTLLSLSLCAMPLAALALWCTTPRTCQRRARVRAGARPTYFNQLTTCKQTLKCWPLRSRITPRTYKRCACARAALVRARVSRFRVNIWGIIVPVENQYPGKPTAAVVLYNVRALCARCCCVLLCVRTCVP